MEIFQHSTDTKERIFNFVWQINNYCNYRCWYCFVEKENKVTNRSTIDRIISILSKLPLPFNIRLMGGEPTLVPHLSYIVNSLYNLQNCQSITIITNFSVSIDFWKKYEKYSDKLSLHISYHSKYEKPIPFIEKVQQLELDYLVGFLYDNDKKLEVFDILRNNIDNIFLRPIYQNDDRPVEEDSIFVLNGNHITYQELREQNLLDFRGWTCCEVQKMMEIKMDGLFINMCTSEIVDPLSIESYDMICTKERCRCGKLIRLKKWK